MLGERDSEVVALYEPEERSKEESAGMDGSCAFARDLRMYVMAVQ